MEDRIIAKIEANTALDRFKLEEEAQGNSSQLSTNSTIVGEAETKMGKAKRKVKEVRANAELRIRKTPPKEYGLEKYTDPTIAALVEVDAEVKVAEEDFLQAQDIYLFYSGQVAALQEKSKQLKNLTYLWGNGYYSMAGVRDTYPKHGQQEED